MEFKLKKTRFKNKKVPRWIIFLSIGLLAGIIFATALVMSIGNKGIYKGVYIDDKPVGGMKKDEAIEHLIRNNRRSADAFELTLLFDDYKWVIDSEDIGGVLKIEEAVNQAFSIGRDGNIFNSILTSRKILKEPVTIYSKFDFDKDKLINKLHTIGDVINKEPIDATIEFKPDDKEKFIITPDHQGAVLNINKLVDIINMELEQGNIRPTIELETEVVEAKVKYEELKLLTNCLASFSTDLSNSSENRTHNVVLAAKAFNGLMVKPGDVVSFNTVTGDRTLENGYRNAPAIAADKSFEDVPGGGVCQTSSTLYNVALRAGLEIIESSRHSIPSSYIGKGLDATVNLPSPVIDLKFKNNYDTPIFIRSYSDSNKITFEIYGKELPNNQEIKIRTEEYETVPAPEPETIEDTEGKYVKYEDETFEKVKSREGYKVRVYKDTFIGDELISSELIDDHYYLPIKGIVYVGVQKRVEDNTDDDPIQNKDNDGSDIIFDKISPIQ